MIHWNLVFKRAIVILALIGLISGLGALNRIDQIFTHESTHAAILRYYGCTNITQETTWVQCESYGENMTDAQYDDMLRLQSELDISATQSSSVWANIETLLEILVLSGAILWNVAFPPIKRKRA